MTFDGCKEIRMYVSGPKALVVTGALTSRDNVGPMRAVEEAVEPVDAQLVVLAEANAATSVAPAFLGGQAWRNQLVVLPWDLIGEGTAAIEPADAERFADRLGTQMQLPVARVRPTAGQIEQGRFVPVDALGREVSAEAAAAFRALPWSHVAARAAMRTAVELATGALPPSPARLEQFLTDLGWLGARLPERAPAAAQLAAAYLARYGVPPTFDVTTLTASPMPVTEQVLHTLMGGEPVTADPVRSLLALTGHPGATALVSYLPAPGQPRETALVGSDAGGLWWYDPKTAQAGAPARYVPATDQLRTAYLREGSTRILLVDRSGQVSTPEELLPPVAAAPVDPAPEVAPSIELPPPVQVFMARTEGTPAGEPAGTSVGETDPVTLTEAQLDPLRALVGVPADLFDWLDRAFDRIRVATAAELPTPDFLWTSLTEFARGVLPMEAGNSLSTLVQLGHDPAGEAYPLPIVLHLLDQATARPAGPGRPAATDLPGWQALLDELWTAMPDALDAELDQPGVAAAAADLMLARWWSQRFAVPFGQIQEALLGANPPDLREMYAAAVRDGVEPWRRLEQWSPSGRVRPADLAAALEVDESLLAPTRQLMAGYRDGVGGLVREIEPRLQELDQALPGLAEPRVALTFLSERGLVLEDLADEEATRVEVAHWLAESLGVPPSLASDLTGRPWFGVPWLNRHLQKISAARGLSGVAIRDTANALGVSPIWLASYSLRTGRVPTDLAGAAARWGVQSPRRLFRLLSELGIDVGDLDRAWTGAAALTELLSTLNGPGDDRSVTAMTLAGIVRDDRLPRPRRSPLVDHFTAAVSAAGPPQALADVPPEQGLDGDLVLSSAQVHDEVVVARRNLDARTTELAAVYGEFSEAQRRRAAVAGELTVRRGRQMDLSTRKKQLTETRRGWLDSRPELDQAVAEAAEAVTEANEWVTSTHDEIRTTTAAAEELTDRLPGLRAAVVTAREVFDAAAAAAPAVADRTALTAAEAAVTTAEAALESLAEKADRLRKQLTGQEAEAARRSAALEGAQDAVQGLRDRIEAAGNRLRVLSGELTTLDDRIRNLTDQAREHAVAATEVLPRLATARDVSDQQRTTAGEWRDRQGRQADLTDLSNPRMIVPVNSRILVTPATAQRVEQAARETLNNYWADQPNLPVDERVPVAQRNEIERELLRYAARNVLERQMSTMDTRSGKTYVIGEGKKGIRATFSVVLRRPAERAGRDGEELQGQNREQHSAGSIARYSARNTRDFAPSLSGLGGLAGRFIGSETVGQIRSLAPNLGANLTWNQSSRNMSITSRSVQAYMLRLRESHYPHPYEATWTVKIAPVGNSLDDNAGVHTSEPVTTDEPVTIWIPEHIARPPGPITELAGTDAERRDALVEDRLVLLDGLHDPGTIEHQLRQRLPDLDRLNADGQRALLDLLDQSDIKGAHEDHRNFSLLSRLLHNSGGDPIGYLRLRIRPIPRHRLTEAPKARMETYRTDVTGLSGTADLTNAADVALTLGGNVVKADLPTTATYGAYNIGTPAFRAGVATGGTRSMESGGPSSMLKGWESGVDEEGVMYSNEVLETDLEITAQLMDMTTESAPVTWTGRAADGDGAWVRRVPLRLGAPDPGLHPPAEIEHGGTGSIGHTEMSGLTVGDTDIDQQVLAELKSNGYVAMGKGATEKQVANYGEFLRVTQEGHRETNWADLDGDGIWTTFERNIPGVGRVERITVRWTTETLAGATAEHEGASRTGKIFAGSEGGFALTNSDTVTGSLGFRGGLDITIGTHEPSLLTTVVNIGPGMGERAYDRTAEHGPAFENQTIIESPVGNVHAFKVRRTLTARMYRANSNTAFWTSNRDPDGTRANVPDITARAWVPDQFVRSDVAPPPPPYTVREVTQNDRDNLARRVDQHHSTLTATTGVAGSPALNELFRQLATDIFGGPKHALWGAVTAPSPAAHGSGSAAARRAFLSPAALLVNKDAFLNHAYVTENQFELGMASQSQGGMQVQAYVGTPRFIPARNGGPQPRGYFEHTAGVVEGHGQSQSLRRVLQADGGWQFVFGPNDATTLTTPFGGRGTVGWSRSQSGSQDASDGRTFTYEGPVYAVSIPLTFVGKMAGGFHNLATTLAELVNDLSGSAERAVDVPDAIQAYLNFDELTHLWRAMRAIGGDGPAIQDLPADLESRLQAAAEQAKRDEAARRAHEVPQDDPGVRFLPRRLAARLGVGEGTSHWFEETAGQVEPPRTEGRPARQVPADEARRRGVLPRDRTSTGPAGTVFEMGDPGPSTAAARAGAEAGDTAAPPEAEPVAHRGLFTAGLNSAETQIPGITRPASRTYAGVVWSTVADIVRPEVVGPALVRYFSAGIDASRVRLVSRKFETTMDFGAVTGRVELYARPAPGFDTFEQTRKLFGRIPQDGDSGTETHAVLGQNKSAGSGRSRAGGGTSGVSVLAPDKNENIRWDAINTSVRGTSSTSRSSGLTEGSGDRHTSRNSAGHVDFPVPVQVAVRVVFDSTANLVNRLGPATRRLVSGTPADAFTWVDGNAHLLIPERDTTTAPLRVEAPEWLRPARAGLDEDAVRGLQAGLEPYTSAPRFDRISFFNGQDTLAAVTREVLPAINADADGAEHIREYFTGMTGEINTHRLLGAAGSAEREFIVGGADSAFEHSGTVRVEPIAATPWQPSTDQVEGADEPFVIGADGRSVIERFQTWSARRRAGRGASQNLAVNLSGGPNLFLARDQIGKEFKNAPGNVSTLAVNPLNLTVTGGEPLQATADGGPSGHLGERMTGLHGGATGTPNVLANRIVLMRVTGIHRRRPRGATAWREEPPAVRYVLGTVEDRINLSDLDDTYGIPAPAPALAPIAEGSTSGPPLNLIVMPVQEVPGQNLESLIPQSTTGARDTAEVAQRRFLRWADTHAVELDVIRAADTTVDGLLSQLREPLDRATDRPRLTLHDFLLQYDQLRAHVTAAGLRSHPVGALAQGTAAYRWLVDRGVHARAAERMAFDLFLDLPGAERFMALAEALELAPVDLMREVTEQSGRLGLPHPEPLYAVSRDLALSPGTIAGAVGDLLSGLGRDGTVAALRDRLAGAGVRSDADLSALIELTTRIAPEDRAGLRSTLGDLADRHVPAALLNLLQDDLIGRALRNNERQRSTALSDVAARLGLSGAQAVRSAATALAVPPGDMIFVVGDGILADLVPPPEYDQQAGPPERVAPPDSAPDEQGRQFADRVRERLAGAGIDDPLMWMRASATLGFGVHELVAAVPRETAGRYLVNLLDNVRPGDVATTLDWLVPEPRTPDAQPPAYETTPAERPERTAYLLGLTGTDPADIGTVATGLGVTPSELAVFREVFRLNLAAPRAHQAGPGQLVAAIRSFLGVQTAAAAGRQLRLLARGRGPAGYSPAQIHRLAAQPFEDEATRTFHTHRDRANAVADAIVEYVTGNPAQRVWPMGASLISPMLGFVRSVNRVADGMEADLRSAAGAARYVAREAVTLADRQVDRPSRQPSRTPFRRARPEFRELPWDSLFQELDRLEQLNGNASRDDVVSTFSSGLRVTAETLNAATAEGTAEQRAYAGWLAERLGEIVTELAEALSALQQASQGPVPAAWDRHARSVLTAAATGGDPVAEADLVLAHWWLIRLELTRLPDGGSPVRLLADADSGYRYAGFLRHAVERNLSPDRVQAINAVAHELGVLADARTLVRVAPDLEAGRIRVERRSREIAAALDRLPLGDADAYRRMMFLADSGLTVGTPAQGGFREAGDQWTAGGLGIAPAELAALRRQALAADWETLVESLRADLERREPTGGWDTVSLGRLATRLGVSPFALRGHSVLTGRVPSDLGAVADLSGIDDPARLFALAARLQADHRELAAGLRHPAVRDALNGGTSRAAAVDRAAALLKPDAPAPREWLRDLARSAATDRAVPADLAALAERAGLTPGEFAAAAKEVAELSGPAATAGRGAIVAFVESVPVARTAGLSPADLAAGFQQWAERLNGFGIKPIEIAEVHEQLRPAGRAIGAVDNAVDAREAIDFAYGRLYGSSPQELTKALDSASQRYGDHRSLLTIVRRINDVMALAGRTAEPIVAQPPPANARVTVTLSAQRATELQTLFRNARDVQVSDTADPDRRTMAIGLGHGWATLARVLPLLHPAQVLEDALITVPHRIPGRRGVEMAVEGLRDLSLTETQALIIAVGSPEAVRADALRALGREQVRTSSGTVRLLAPTGVFEPSPALFAAFPGTHTRGIAMMAATMTANRLSPPEQWWARRAAQHWQPVGVASATPGDELAEAALESARRQSRALPPGVTDVATLMAHVATQVRTRPTAFSQLSDQRNGGALYVGMLDDATVDHLGRVAEAGPEALASPAATRAKLIQLFDTREAMFLGDMRTRAQVADPDLAALLARIAAPGPFTAQDLVGAAITQPNLRRLLPPELVDQAISTALNVNLLVLSQDGHTVQESQPRQPRTLVIGEGPAGNPRAFRAYGPPPPVSLQVEMASPLPEPPGGDVVAAATMNPFEMARVAAGIRSDLVQGFGRTLPTRLAGHPDALALVEHLRTGAAGMQRTLMDPGELKPAAIWAKYQELLRTLDQTLDAVRTSVPDMAAALPDVPAMVGAWSAEPVDHAARKPGQAAWMRGRLTMIGTKESWAPAERLVTSVSDLAAAAGRPVLLIHGEGLVRPGPGDRTARPEPALGSAEARELAGMLTRYDDPARDSADLTTLGSVLTASRMPPVVVTTGESTTLTAMLQRRGVVQIARVPTALGSAWHVIAPGVAEPVATAEHLDGGLFARAGKLSGRPVGPAPAVLDGWLAQRTWAAAGDYLAEHLAGLRDPAVKDALAGMRTADPDNRELAAYEVVLNAAERFGGMGDEVLDAWRPAPTSNALGAPGMAAAPPPGPVPPRFLTEFLDPLGSYDLRRGWNDALLQLLYSGQLSGPEVVALSRALIAADGTPSAVDHGTTNTKVFTATAAVLATTPQEAAESWNDDGGLFRLALELLQNCAVSPTDRWLSVLRIANLRDLLAAQGRPGHFGPEDAGHHRDLLDLLATTLSNC